MKEIQIQQGTDEWLNMRLGKITGTRLKKLFGKTKYAKKTGQDSLINEMIAEMFTGQGELIPVNQHMIRGTNLEDEALQKYANKTGNVVKKIGFVTTDDDFLGLSPDGLIEINGKYIGATEVKCPMSKTVVKYKRQGGIPDEYYYQVMHYFIVIDTIDWLDFIVYDPRFKEKELYVVRTKRSEYPIDEALEEINKFKAKLFNELDKIK